MQTSQTADGTGFRQDVQRLGQGVDAVKTDVGILVHGAVDAARSGADELRHGAQSTVESAKQKIAEAKEAATDAANSFKDVIARNPVTSIGIAAGVGLIVGLLVFRPRS